jgi:hypothetical protein
VNACSRAFFNCNNLLRIGQKNIEQCTLTYGISEVKSAYWVQRLQSRLQQPTEDKIMLYTIAVVLLILWLLGLVTSYTVGGFIHILLVVAVIMILVRLISGRGI